MTTLNKPLPSWVAKVVVILLIALAAYCGYEVGDTGGWERGYADGVQVTSDIWRQMLGLPPEGPVEPSIGVSI